MTEFARELLFECVQEAAPLLQKHYDELTVRKDIVVLDPMWKEYALLEQLGRFMVFTARDQGMLVGYNAFFVNRHLHYASLTVAQNDVFWLTQEFRTKPRVALRFLGYCHKYLLGEGADKVVYHAKPGNNFAPILRTMGFADEETMLGKFIKEGA